MRYSHAVTVPFAGAFITTIESDEKNPDPDTIAEAAQETITRLEMEGDAEIIEWSAYGRIVQGNICYVTTNLATIDETEDFDED